MTILRTMTVQLFDNYFEKSAHYIKTTFGKTNER